ncbi:hypothetical protein [Pigmentiphaga sp.]|uniref:hypothetical protein n=1 Tax=Pigmentiphaga sp. TaxID=1977564 RepID=UPI0025F4AAA6|nr:hypothetical protein [Pigmentiphaga sp.]
MTAEELEQWLLGLPLDEAVEIDGERVYLKPGDGGAELGLVLASRPTGEQIREAARTGFQGALEFAAGLALAGDDGALVLNRWLDGVETWSDAAGELEDLLNQAALWRAAMAVSRSTNEAARRAESHARKALNRGLL